MTVLAVVGLKREAQIVSRAGVRVAIGRAVETAIGPETRGIISIGIAGALAGSLGVGDPVIGRSIVTMDESFAADDAWTSALVGKLRFGTLDVAIAGVDEIAASPAAKAALKAQLPSAFAVDMESHIAARAAAAHGIPFAALRVISDTAVQSLPPAALVAMKPDGGIAYGRVLLSVLMRPMQIPELIRTGRRADCAFATLERCVAILGSGLGCPT